MEKAGYGSINEFRGNVVRVRNISNFRATEKRMSWLMAAPFLVLVIFLVFLMASFEQLPETDVEALSALEKEGIETLYFDQVVDHLDDHTSDTFSQRYYAKKSFFLGPGHPIFFIFGGEDPLEGPLYPFIYDHLAKDFGAITFALEHRFYGESMPVERPTHEQMHKLFIMKQALWDASYFIQAKRRELGCSLDRHSDKYCPAISVGASYPGFLSALMRFEHPDVVDISYASSAPLNLYSHHTDQYAYYEKVTATADEASPGCADAVRSALLAAQDDITSSQKEAITSVAQRYGICPDSVPTYIGQNMTLFSQELMMIVATHFAEGNMDYYPPGPDQPFVQGCLIFQEDEFGTPEEKVAEYLLMGSDDRCFDMMTELPPGPNGTISASDWSGVGSGPEGYYWDFQSCQLIPECGFSAQSMFPPRRWTLDWVTKHCMDRFSWKPDPGALERTFGFDDRSDVTHLLMTNGIVDGWSIASVMVQDSPGIRVVNMKEGAHHSDLSHTGPTPRDTSDVVAAFAEIRAIIKDWLDDIE